jgi:hypothetical protein
LAALREDIHEVTRQLEEAERLYQDQIQHDHPARNELAAVTRLQNELEKKVS